MSVSHVDMQLACRTKALSLTTTLSAAFARAGTANYTDVNGIVQVAGINVPRNAHYVGGVSTVLNEAASTNTVLWSRDMSNAAWTKSSATATLNATGLDGTANSATTVTDTSAVAVGFVRATATVVPADTATHSTGYWVLKDSNQSRFPRFQSFISGGTTVQRNVSLNTATGASALISGTGTHRVIDGGLWWILEITLTNNGTASNTSLNCVAVASERTTISGVVDLTLLGSIVLGQVQVEINKTAITSPIYTTTAAASRAADVGALFSATTTGYTRDVGSFITDGYSPGTQVRPVGFTNTVPDTLTNVTALTITTRSTHPAETGILNRNFTVGLPSDFAWENLRFTPTQGVPYVKEEYLPGPMSLNSFGSGGDITVEPTYRLTVFVPQNSGISADGQYADALLNLFAPSTEMLLPDGNVLFVRADVAPIRGQRTQQQGLTGIPITIPLRALISNAIDTNPFYVIFADVDGDIAISSSVTAALGDYQVVTIDSGGDPNAP